MLTGHQSPLARCLVLGQALPRQKSHGPRLRATNPSKEKLSLFFFNPLSESIENIHTYYSDLSYIYYPALSWYLKKRVFFLRKKLEIDKL